MKKLTLIAAVAAGLALSASVSKAQITYQTDLLNQPFDITGTTMQIGSVSSWVYNNNGVGDIYIYEITVSSAPDNSGSQISIGGFTTSDIVNSAVVLSGVNEDASFPFTPPAGDTPPTPNTAVTYGGNSAGVLNFANSSGIPNGSVTYYMEIQTTSTTYDDNTARLQDDYQGSGTILAPVPEASTVMAGALMLLPLGVGAIRAIRKEHTA